MILILLDLKKKVMGLSRGAGRNREIWPGEDKILMREFGLLRLICALFPKRRLFFLGNIHRSVLH